MNKKVKLKGRLNMYMRWPVFLSGLLLVAAVLMYLVDYRAGLLMTACFVLYVAAAVVIYIYLRPSIVDELVNFAIEFAQVQHNLIHDLEIPYAILDETGKILWVNSCMKEITGEFVDMKNISTLIPDIKPEMLPDDEEEKKYAHIRYKERYYKAEIMKVCIDDFAMDNKVVELQPEAYQLFAFYLFDETEIRMSRKEIQNQKLICGIILVDNYEEALNSGKTGEKLESRIYNQLGLCQMAEEDYETAADTFDKGYNALITGYKAGTGAELDQAAAAIPKEDTQGLTLLKELAYNKAVCLEYRQQYRQAQAEFETYIKVFGDDEDARHEIDFLKTRQEES